MTDRVTFSKEEYKEKKIRIYITFPSGLFQSNLTGNDDFESDVDCLEQAKHNIDTGNIKIKKKTSTRKKYKHLGYIHIKCPHPFSDNNGFMREHRIVLEHWLRKYEPGHPALIEINGIKYLNPKWISHHKNGKKDDNRPENLKAVTAKQHRLLHTAKGLTDFLEKNPDVKISKEYYIG